MMDVDVNDILDELSTFSIIPADDVAHRIKELCYRYKSTAEDIAATWVAFAATKKLNMEPTMKTLDMMESEELVAKSNKSKQRKSHSSVATPVHNSSTIGLISEDDYGVPVQESRKSSLGSSPNVFSPNSMSPARFTPSRRYVSRNGSGEVVCSFGHMENVEWKHSDEFSCSIMPYSDRTVLRESYRFMCDKLRDRASILNDMIQEAAQYFQEKYDITEWGHLHLPSVETVPVIGRIYSDSGDKLNASSILLEGSQEMSSGQTVALDISHLERFSFFPGQIISGLGVNNSGKKFLLNNLYDSIFPPFPPKTPDLASCYDCLSIVVAAGPFATSDTLSFEPLNDLMKYVKTHMPHVVILVGPFIDIKNEVIENGEMCETYEELFQNLVAQIISHIDHLSSKVILVPSTRDAHHENIYPTPPFKAKQSIKRLYLASDPCILNIEGVIIAITAEDILFHLGKEEIASQNMPDRLGRLCSHLLTQRNFYPLYPANEEINIDYPHFELYGGLPVTPHILILPSDLRYFIKDINGCCCVNPERLTKRFTGGTFARIKVKRIKEEEYNGSVINSLKAEIVKI